MTVWERLEGCQERAVELGHDLRVECGTATECAWSCEVSWTQEPNAQGKPDFSLTYFAAGGATPEDCLARCLDELEPFLFG